MGVVRLSPAVTFYLPAILMAVVMGLGLREWQVFRRPRRQQVELFPYTKLRFVLRMLGLLVLLGVALTLAAMGRWPPESASQASRYFGALSAELALLLTLVLADLWALGRARPRRRSPGEHP